MEERQHDKIRVENMRMVQSLVATRKSLVTGHRKKLSNDEVTVIMGQLTFLEHVLEFSATWNGVESQEFFPDTLVITDYLSSHQMFRLEAFFKRHVREVSRELQAIGVKYPFLLKKLHSEFHQRTFQKMRVPPPV